MQQPRSTMAAAVRAGRSASKTSTDIFKTTRKDSPKHTELASVALKARSAEKQAAMSADARARQTDIKAEAKVDLAEIDVDRYKSIQDSKRTVRKAGLVAAAGQTAAGGILASKKPDPIKPTQIDFSSFDEYYDRKEEEMKDPNWGKPKVTPVEDPMAGMSPTEWEAAGRPEYGKPGNTVQSPDAAISGEVTKRVEASKTDTVSTAAPANNGNIGPVSPARNVAFKTILESAKRVGGAKFPEVVAAQAMHESNYLGDQGVYKATGYTNPFGQTGDRGYGTIPRKGFKDGWTLYPDLDTAVSDHITLWHDTKNHSGNYNAYGDRQTGIRSVAPAYSPNEDPENIRLGYTETGYTKGVNRALTEAGY